MRARHAHLIESCAARLDRPEDVAFSPSGDLKAVANSDANSILLYARSGTVIPYYETTPCCELKDHNVLNYVHSVDFSPDGSWLGAVAREGHTLVFYQRRGSGPEFDQAPVHIISGEGNGLVYPTGVALHPSGQYAAVANRMGEAAVAIYTRAAGSEIPCQFDAMGGVSREKLVQHDLAAAHGLAFTPDGRRLLVCHSKFFKSDDKRGRPAISVFEFDSAAGRVSSCQPLFIHPFERGQPHSVAVHPSGAYIGLTICDGGSLLMRIDARNPVLEPMQSITHERKRSREGPKGIGFSRDGNAMEITNADHEIQVFELSA